MAQYQAPSQASNYTGHVSGLNSLQFAHLRHQPCMQLAATPPAFAPSHLDAMSRLPELANAPASSVPGRLPQQHKTSCSLSANAEMRAAVLRAAHEATASELQANHERQVSKLQRSSAGSSTLASYASSHSTSSRDFQYDSGGQVSELRQWARFPASLRTSAIYPLSSGGWSARAGWRASSLVSALLRQDFSRFNKKLRISPRPSTMASCLVLLLPAVGKLFVQKVGSNTFRWTGPTPVAVEHAAAALGCVSGPTLDNLHECVAFARDYGGAEPQLPGQVNLTQLQRRENTQAQAIVAASQQSAAVRAAASVLSTQRTAHVMPANITVPSSAITLEPEQSMAPAPAASFVGTEYDENPELAIDSIASLLG